MLGHIVLPDEYYYAHLPLCVVDAVFSIGAVYTSTQNTVKNFCQFVGIEPLNRQRENLDHLPLTKEQFSIADLLYMYENMTYEQMVDTVFQNRQRTSSRNGILKAEAVRHFSQVLHDAGILYFQDLSGYMHDEYLKNTIKQIPGQRSGVSLSYFFMLAGNEDLIKPDRMVIRFIESVIGRAVGIIEAQILLNEVCQYLRFDFPDLTLRKLDYAIWDYQRKQGN